MRNRRKQPMGKVTRGNTAEACLRRILDAWVPAVNQHEWIREAPNAKSAFAFRKEPMTDQEVTLLTDIRENR